MCMCVCMSLAVKSLLLILKGLGLCKVCSRLSANGIHMTVSRLLNECACNDDIAMILRWEGLITSPAMLPWQDYSISLTQ